MLLHVCLLPSNGLVYEMLVLVGALGALVLKLVVFGVMVCVTSFFFFLLRWFLYRVFRFDQKKSDGAFRY